MHMYMHRSVLLEEAEFAAFWCCSYLVCKACQGHLCMVEALLQQWTLLHKQLLKVSERLVLAMLGKWSLYALMQ